jgi:rSAM/selenodomain-associated transferase 1
MQKNLLIIFTKNPELGKVKTRLAQTIGNDKALLIYKHLLTHTANFCKEVNADKHVFYSDIIGDNEYFNSVTFKKLLQEGDDLGEKMKKAFIDGFSKGYKNIIVIGSDCYDLTTNDLDKAFEKLNFHDFVLGPALDGGYYLLGMNTPFYSVFENKTWSTESVLRDTINDIKEEYLSYFLINELSDIDYEEDLNQDLRDLI